MVTSSSSLSPPPSSTVLAVNVVLYALLAFMAWVVSRQNLDRLSTVPKFIALASLLRIAWFASEYAGWGDAASCRDAKGFVSFAGRLSAVLYFSAFSSVLFFWWDALRKRSDGLVPDEGGLSICEPRTVDILLKFWVFVVLAGLFMYKFFECDDANRQRVADAEIVAISLVFGALAIGLASVGGGLRVKLSYRESVASSQLSFRILAITVTCSVLFLMRVFLFLLYPVFDLKLKGAARQALYPWFFYTVPEVVPCVVLLFVLMKRRKVSVSMEDALLVAPMAHTRPSEDSLHVFRV
jgi:hypothetical protein